jgi:hypothetical protein
LPKAALERDRNGEGWAFLSPAVEEPCNGTKEVMNGAAGANKLAAVNLKGRRVNVDTEEVKRNRAKVEVEDRADRELGGDE